MRSSRSTASSVMPCAAARNPTIRAPSASVGVLPNATLVSSGPGGPPVEAPRRPSSTAGQPMSGQPIATTAPWHSVPVGHQEPSVISGARPPAVAAAATLDAVSGAGEASTSTSSSPGGSDQASSPRRA